MVCVECYLPFVAMLLHFLWPYFAAIVKRTTGIELAAPKRAVCPLPASSSARKQAPPAAKAAAPQPQAEAEAEASSASPAAQAPPAEAEVGDPASVN
jgi:hypothetical protein